MKRLAVAGLIMAALLAVFASRWASPEPDGLERVAIDRGFAEEAREHDLAEVPLADYGVRGLEGRVGGSVAGLVGVAVTAALGVALLKVAGRRKGPFWSRRTTPDVGKRLQKEPQAGG